ncbi:MAG: transglycosylase [Methylocystaceae bacterium]|nr:MAG: transglycosylase [Methylocystaceae bacterium]
MSDPIDLEPIGFDALPAIDEDDLVEAFRAFRRSAASIAAGARPQRPAAAPREELLAVSRLALENVKAARSNAAARVFFQTHFRPFRLPGSGFLTAYYEGIVDARLTPDDEFRTPVLARPDDLVTLNEAPIVGEDGEILTGARRLSDGSLAPFPDRRAIEEHDGFEQRPPIAYVRDPVELFLMQVQGSARLRLADGGELTLTYDGRNSRPYTSIGRLLVERGLVPAEAMSLETLMATVRAMGQEPGAPGARLMQENRSYVFFRADASQERRSGPIGGQGCALTPFRSIAVDRSLWSYGLPFFITADLPWRGVAETRFERLMIAQDTGSAIVGAARADLFFGSGEGAGHLAGRVRHAGEFVVLLPRRAGDGR